MVYLLDHAPSASPLLTTVIKLQYLIQQRPLCDAGHISYPDHTMRVFERNQVILPPRPGTKPHRWTPERILALRKHMGCTQADFARRLGIRQQTVSEWEIGVYAPRGASVTVLEIVARAANFKD